MKLAVGKISAQFSDVVAIGTAIPEYVLYTNKFSQNVKVTYIQINNDSNERTPIANVFIEFTEERIRIFPISHTFEETEIAVASGLEHELLTDEAIVMAVSGHTDMSYIIYGELIT